MIDDLPLPTPPEALFERLNTMGIAYELHQHEAVFTAAEAAFLRNIIPGIHCKNLFVRDKREKMALIVVPDEVSLDLKALAPAIGLEKLSFGSPERLWTHLGVRPGSVCPYAVVNDTTCDVKLFIDARITAGTRVVAHPMLNTMSIAVDTPDLLRFLESTGHSPTIIDLAPYERMQAA